MMHVLGGGPAGMAMLFYAHRAGMPLRVYEAASFVGGNARTIEWGEFRYDSGAHRLHHKDQESLQDFLTILGDEVHVVDAPSQIYLDGRLLDFPLSPFDLLRKLPKQLLFTIARENLGPRRTSAAVESFASRAEAAYGPTLANNVLLNYSRKLWGVELDDLDPVAAGGRLNGLDLKTFLLEGLRGAKARTRHLDGSFHYPRLGIGQLFDRIVAQAGAANVQLNARITAIEHKGNQISGFELESGEHVACRELCSTLPLGLMIQLLRPAPPDAVRAAAAQLMFRHIRLLVLALNCRSFTSNASVYMPTAGASFTRIYEPKNRSAAMAPADKTAIVIEFPCFAHESMWRMSDDELFTLCMRQMDNLGLLHSIEVLDACGLRLFNAYPVPQLSTQRSLRVVRDYLAGIRGLHIIGRGAEFRYTHIHDLFKSAREFVELCVK